MQVLFCCDPAYYQHLAVAAVSLLANNPGRIEALHVISSGRDDRQEERLRQSLLPFSHEAILDIHTFDIERCRRFAISQHFTHEIYVRIFAPEILGEQVEKILYLDSDLVVIGDVAPLWETSLEGYALAAVPDPYVQHRCAELGMNSGSVYVNDGVMMLNLQEWRARDLSRQLVAYITREGRALHFHEQDAINAVVTPAIRLLDYEWNFQAQMFLLWPWMRQKLGNHWHTITEASQAPKIIHYTTPYKPWRRLAPVNRQEFYFHYLARTAWAGSAKPRPAWYDLPEWALNHALHLVGLDYALVRSPKRYLVREALRRAIGALRDVPLAGSRTE